MRTAVPIVRGFVWKDKYCVTPFTLFFKRSSYFQIKHKSLQLHTERRPITISEEEIFLFYHCVLFIDENKFCDSLISNALNFIVSLTYDITYNSSLALNIRRSGLLLSLN